MRSMKSLSIRSELRSSIEILSIRSFRLRPVTNNRKSDLIENNYMIIKRLRQMLIIPFMTRMKLSK